VVDNKNGVNIDESRITLVDFRKIGYGDDEFNHGTLNIPSFYV